MNEARIDVEQDGIHISVEMTGDVHVDLLLRKIQTVVVALAAELAEEPRPFDPTETMWDPATGMPTEKPDDTYPSDLTVWDELNRLDARIWLSAVGTFLATLILFATLAILT